jgi:hypothetical protein
MLFQQQYPAALGRPWNDRTLMENQPPPAFFKPPD